ncbi:FG-GAP repeat domain-containing protein [Pendulispora albinea]|uniref:VCBS repeat-containing protein n=1 Tax=Pendulispora albinea TaxID=2741071 RepID=A0ABZ2M3Z9_9BACT
MPNEMKRIELAFVLPIVLGASLMAACASDATDVASSEEELNAPGVPPAPRFGPWIDGYQPYVGQSGCDPVAKPGVISFRDLLRSTYGRNDMGIVRACNQGGTSEHKEGRALDYPFNVTNSGQRAEAEALLNWLLQTDQYGNPHAYSRRLGIMYIIWNHKIWNSNNPQAGWTSYSGPNPHTDHIHFSFGWPGARGETSWWRGVTRGPSLSGEGRAEIMALHDNGDIQAWYNVAGFKEMPWGGSVTIGRGFSDPSRVRFADLDGDGYSDIIAIQENGDVQAWHNGGAFKEMPWDGAAIIGRDFFDPNRVRLADLDGDGRAEIMAIQENGDIQAWHNGGGFKEMPWDGAAIIGRGFLDPNEVQLADLDGDGRAEIMAIHPNGEIQAWYNAGGFKEMPWGDSTIVGRGFTDPSRARFADLDGDGRAEIVAIQSNGDVQAWHNDGGFKEMPWGASLVIAIGFTDPTRTFFP